MKKQISPKVIALTFSVVTLLFAFGFYIFAWNNPTASAPNENASAPLNTSNVGQTKAGGLILNTSGADYGLIVQSGRAKFGNSIVLSPNNQPASGEQGQIYFNQNDKYLYFYNGNLWIRMGGTEGELCNLDSQCASGYCADGYCCNSACSSTCYACNVAGAIGTCTALTNYTEEPGCSNACVGCYAGSCTNIPSGNKDNFGANLCNTTHYVCSGGSCTAPGTITTYSSDCQCWQCGNEMGFCCGHFGTDPIPCTSWCSTHGHDACNSATAWAFISCPPPGVSISCGASTGSGSCSGCYTCNCIDWTYD